MSHPQRAPKAPPATTPNDPRYWDERDLEDELLRTFQICHECRMCVNYCGSFPELFNRVDRDVDAGRAEGAELVDADDIRVVSDECWQCKICYIKCPYTADEGAYEMLDFPRLMAREKAVRAKRNGVTFTDKVLGEPQLIGQLGGGPLAGATNLINESRLLRKVSEKVTGISAEFPLPSLASQPFPAWLRKRKPSVTAGEAGDVVLFATCYGNYNNPDVPKAAVIVLEHLGYRVIGVEETCCGMPNLDGGDVAGAVAKIRANAAELVEHVRAGAKVLVPNPTCGYTMKREWVEYVDEPEVHEVAEATRDLMEFFEELRRAKLLPKADEPLGNVAYHAACHLRAQKIGFPGARVLTRQVPETEVRIMEQCSAVDGTWGMKAEHYETGRKYAQKLKREVDEPDTDLVVTDCPLSALRIHKENDVEALHPVQALAKAYGLI